jgi:hypothetical protein
MTTALEMSRYPKKKYEPAWPGVSGDPCAGACGGLSIPRSIYCQECKDDQEDVAPPETEHELDIYTEVLAEKMRGETTIKDKLEEQGPRPCGLCGRPSLPWRLYCSPRCRGRAARLGPATFELDGVVDSLLGHARRIGIDDSTVRKRMRKLGMTPKEALTIPVDERPLFERRTS